MAIVVRPPWPITWKHGTILLGITENSLEGKKSTEVKIGDHFVLQFLDLSF